MINTFADLIAAPDSNKVFLLEVDPSQLILDWTQRTATTEYSVYSSVLLDSTVNLIDLAVQGTSMSSASNILTQQSVLQAFQRSGATLYVDVQRNFIDRGDMELSFPTFKHGDSRVEHGWTPTLDTVWTGTSGVVDAGNRSMVMVAGSGAAAGSVLIGEGSSSLPVTMQGLQNSTVYTVEIRSHVDPTTTSTLTGFGISFQELTATWNTLGTDTATTRGTWETLRASFSTSASSTAVRLSISGGGATKVEGEKSYWDQLKVFAGSGTDVGVKETPFGRSVVADFSVYFGTEAKTFNDHYYAPFIRGIPAIKQAKNDQFWGVSITSDATVKIWNGNGHFDETFDTYAWNNKDARLLLGGEDLPFSEYRSVFTGIVRSKQMTTGVFDLKLSDKKHILDDAATLETFNSTAYPNAPDSVLGNPVPLVYGMVRNIPVANITENASGTATHRFKFASTATRAVVDVSQVYVNGVAVSHAASSTSAATFDLSTTVYTIGDTVTADVQGYTLSNTVEITKDLLSSLVAIPFGTATWDTATTTIASGEASVFPVGLFVGETTPLIDVIGDLMKSSMGTFFVNNAGKFAVNVWTTDIASGLTTLDFTDIAEGSFSTQAIHNDIRKTARAGWRKDWGNDRYSTVSVSNTDTEQLYGIDRSRTIQTLLSTREAAEVFAGRILLMFERGNTQIKAKTKMQLAGENVGDRIRVTMQRREGETPYSWLNNQAFDVQSITKDFTNNTINIIASNMRDIGAGVGHWTAELPGLPAEFGSGTASSWDPDWSIPQKQYAAAAYGYWTDDDGFAAAGDSESRKKSRWW